MGAKFVGPNSAAIHAMGDKIESKRVAAEAKVREYFAAETLELRV